MFLNIHYNYIKCKKSLKPQTIYHILTLANMHTDRKYRGEIALLRVITAMALQDMYLGIYSDTLPNLPSDIYADVLFGILSDILALYLTSSILPDIYSDILTFFLTLYLASIGHVFWQSI